jgi:hypothetical protein
MDGNMFNGIATAVYAGFVFAVLFLLLGIWTLVNWIWIPTTIKSNKPIIPEMQVKVRVVNNTVVCKDTTYIYRKK